jgi:phosphatidylglycerophosphate synthase
MLDKARPAFKPILEKIAKPFMWVHPNFITLFGFLAGVLFFYLMYKQMYGWALLCYFGVAVDSLDGTIARMTGKESQFGAFFDATLDRITDSLMIIGFAFAAVVSWPLAVLTMLAGLMISYTRAKAEQVSGNKVKLAVGIMERPERLLLLLIASTLLYFGIDKEFYGQTLYDIIFWILLILSTFTVLQRMYAAWKILK